MRPIKRKPKLRKKPSAKKKKVTRHRDPSLDQLMEIIKRDFERYTK